MNILVPTDFTPASLQLAERAIISLQRPLRIVLFHAFRLPFYHQDLVGEIKKPYHDLVTPAFWTQCRRLRTHYQERVLEINMRCMQGSSQGLFDNIVDANDIDAIICPDNHVLRPASDDSLDPRPFFKRAKVELIKELKLAPIRIGRVAELGATLRDVI